MAENKYKKIIAVNIRRYRKEAGISQKELAERLGISQGSVCNWEKGVNGIDVDMLFRVADIIGRPVGDFGREEDEALSLSRTERELVLSFRNCTPERQDIILELLQIKRASDTSGESNKEAI